MLQRGRWRPSIFTAGAGALLAATLLAGTGYSLWREKRELATEAAERQALLARVLEDHASRSLDATLIALTGLADVAERGAPPEVLQALLGQTQASLGFLRGIALLDEAGHVRPMEMIETEALKFAIDHYRGQMSQVARRLGIGRSTLYRKLKDLGIEDNETVTDGV